jgi:uncharacterized protein YndB with AHSA1/START domain
MSEFGKMIDPHTVQFVRILPGPIERIWDFLWDGEKRGQWFASGPMPAKVGEKFGMKFKHSTLSQHQAPPPDRMKEMDKTGHSSSNTLLACEPPYRLAFTFGGEKNPDKISEVEFRLEPEGDKVRLTLTHTKIPDRDIMLGVSGGWHAHLDVLQYRAEGQAPPAFWDIWRRYDGAYDKRYP